MGTTRIGGRRRFHLYISQWRDHRGLSLEELGNRVDPPVAKNTVWRWENEQHRLDPQKIARLAQALDLEPEDLWRPPPGRSIDAILADAAPEMREAMVDMAISLKKTGSDKR